MQSGMGKRSWSMMTNTADIVGIKLKNIFKLPEQFESSIIKSDEKLQNVLDDHEVKYQGTDPVADVKRIET